MTRVVLFLVHNWPLKLAAVVLATLLYGVIVLTQDSRQIPGTVPIEVENQPAGIVRVSELGDVRNIRYFSSDEGVRPDSSNFEAFVDFRGVTQRTGTVVLGVTVRSIDPRVDVLSWEPRQISVSLDELVSRQVRVRVVAGETPEGLDVREPQLELETVEVRGASADVARVDRAEARIEIEPGGLDVDREVTLQPVDAQGETIPQVDVEPSAVRVRIAVFTDHQTRSVPIAPILTGEPAPGFEVAGAAVQPLIVTLEGDDEELRALTRAETQPIAVAGATASFDATVRLALPTGVLAVGSDEVMVTITLRPITATRTFSAGFALDGQRGDLLYALSPRAVLVTIGGSIADLDRLEGRTINVEASVAGLGPGVHQLTMTADLAAGLTLLTVNPSTVTLTVTAPASPPASSPIPSP